MKPEDFRAVRCRKPWHPQPCFHAVCRRCGETVSAFDYTEEESLTIAAGKPPHVCDPAKVNPQESLL